MVSTLFIAASGQSESVGVLRSNFDAVLRIDGAFEEVKSRVEVRDGSSFPIHFHDHKIHVEVSSNGEDAYVLNLSILEKSGNTWFTINSTTLKVEGTFGIPLEYKWNGVELELDLAIVISRARRSQ